MSPTVFYCLALGAMFLSSLLALALTKYTPDAGASLFPLAEDAETYAEGEL